MAKVETTLTLEQLDAALELNGKLRAFDAGYAKGFAAGLEAGAEYHDGQALHYRKISREREQKGWGKDHELLDIAADHERHATAIRERAREEKAKP